VSEVNGRFSTVQGPGQTARLAPAGDSAGRKRAEQALQQRSAQLDAALESIADAVFISDTQGNFIRFNEAFATFHKFRNKVECARTLAEYPTYLEVYLATGELAPLEMWAVPRALRGEIGTAVEYGLRRKDTGERWVGSYSFAPIRDGDGKIIGSVVVGRDITEKTQSRESLRQRTEELEQIAGPVARGRLDCGRCGLPGHSRQPLCQ
jgi:PAS domain-containing protein